MRRPPLPRRAALLLCAGAALVGAARAGAQSSNAIRRGFEPAITPFIGATGFGVRTTGGSGAEATPADFTYKKGIALGAQLDVPLTRRTGLLATLAVSPFTRVQADQGSDAILERDRALVAGVDLGIAARLKPSAPLFAFVGGGALLATKRAADETEGTGFEPRGTVGVGLDLMRREVNGVRLMWLGHFAVPGSPDESRWVPESSAFDYTVILGGRIALGRGRGDDR